MSLVWKTSHGSDAMPEMVVKIIGSKHFRYLVEKPKIKENENLKIKSQTALQKSVTGKSRRMSRDLPAPIDPTDHQINYNPDGIEKSKNPGNNQKPILTEAGSSRFLDVKGDVDVDIDKIRLPADNWSLVIPNRANVHCSSVPTGDQSLSYIHGLPRRNLRDCSLKQMVRGSSDEHEDFDQRPSGTREDAFLLALARRELKSRPLSSSLLDKLQKELKVLDPISSGLLLQSQLSRLLLRHEVPLQLPTIKILCQRFSKRGAPEMVNYGKLLWFLKVVASGDPQQSKTVAESDLRKTQDRRDQSQSNSPQDASSQLEVNKSLSEILKMVLRTTNGKLNIENLNLSFRKEDRSFSGCLPPSKVRVICGKHGLYLTLSLLETLLNQQDLGFQAEIRWQKFVALLNKASSDLSSDLSTGPKATNDGEFPRQHKSSANPGRMKKEAPATPVKPEVPDMSQSTTKHTKTPEEELQPENSPAETLVPKDPLSSLKIRPVSQPFVSPVKKDKSEERETWIDRFRKLENALYLCDLSNTGVLEKERARRLIHNYNLIYNLSLSPRKIDQALRRFRSGENMLLDPALRYLKEL